MALPVRDQLKYWGVAALIFLAVLWVLGNVMLPFVMGGAIAYFLDPVADWLERHGLSRVMATITITLFATIVFALGVLLLLPTLVQQTSDLFETVPELVHQFSAFLIERFPDLLDSESTISKSLMSFGQTLQSKGGEVLNTVLSSAAGLVNVVMLLVLVPVITFYLLIDWDQMVARINDLLPRDHAPTIRVLAGQIDKTLASFIRGQGTVCLILGTFYAIGLMLVGLQFGLVVGAIAGLLTFIPYVGALVGGCLAIGLALFQFWGEWIWIAAVVAIFFVGQFLEGNVLTPKLVGGSIGLHPVWLIFSLSAFGSLFGFVGMLIAVPVAASLGVVARFAISQYKHSLLYIGVDERDEP